MGNTSYSVEDRVKRATTLSYMTTSMDAIFTQNVEGKMHSSMSPKNALVREARDSAEHPRTVPIILALDVTGSMGTIPHELIKHGLPHMMGNMIQKGVEDAALLFLAIGDHEVDRCPLQVGQFESGDKEFDQWLTRTYIEQGGGGNQGESYSLAYYFAAHHTVTDAWEKRRRKGFLFTVGDEPVLKTIPEAAIRNIMGNTWQGDIDTTDILEKAKETYEVYHLHMLSGNSGVRSLSGWKELLGDHCIPIDNPEDVADTVARIVIRGVDELITPMTDPGETEML